MRRDEIDRLVSEYLANGGKITKCPPAIAMGSGIRESVRRYLLTETESSKE